MIDLSLFAMDGWHGPSITILRRRSVFHFRRSFPASPACLHRIGTSQAPLNQSARLESSGRALNAPRTAVVGVAGNGVAPRAPS